MLLVIYAQVIFFYPVLPIYSHIPFVYIFSCFVCIIINLFIQGRWGGALDLYLIQGFILNAYKTYQEEGGGRKKKGRGS